jgi:hypothetical protein
MAVTNPGYGLIDTFTRENTQRISNCSIEPSKINGGTVSQNFNIQSLKVIRGECSFTTFNQGGVATYLLSVLLNPITRSPVNLTSGDVIIGGFIENSSGPSNGSDVEQITNIPNVTPSNITLYFGNVPTYLPAIQIWFPDMSTLSQPIAYTLSLTDINLGKNLSIINHSPVNNNNWIYVIVTSPQFTRNNTGINISLLVASPNLYQ